MDIKTLQELWNPLSKAVPGKFKRYGGLSKCNCLQDGANFHRSRVWQIVLIKSPQVTRGLIIPSEQRSCWGVYWFQSVRPSVRPACRVRSVTSTVLDGFFPYYPQMITTMRGCVAHNDLWPWPISIRSFGLDLENCVRSVASTVLDGFLLYLAQMITIIRGCVACYDFFQNLKIWIFGKFSKFFGLALENFFYSSRWILSICSIKF